MPRREGKGAWAWVKGLACEPLGAPSPQHTREINRGTGTPEGGSEGVREAGPPSAAQHLLRTCHRPGPGPGTTSRWSSEAPQLTRAAEGELCAPAGSLRRRGRGDREGGGGHLSGKRASWCKGTERGEEAPEQRRKAPRLGPQAAEEREFWGGEGRPQGPRHSPAGLGHGSRRDAQRRDMEGGDG